VRAELRAGDLFLLGADLVKREAQMLAAYDDPLGVTAAFNLNLLARINRELGADFDLRAFAHQARYHRRLRRVEMRLRSRREQRAQIPGAGLEVCFQRGETIWTESSHKFALGELAQAASAGFECLHEWVDEEWPFAETLFAAR
jgi:uncharacterized SAM-dependent methyltransferase